MLKTIQKGFTLIELMIVVAIIGILAAIAIPAYQDYTVRSQVTEGLNLASSVKAGVAEYYAAKGEWPTTLAQVGISNTPTGKYVTGITMGTGTILIEYGQAANTQIDTQILALQPKLGGNDEVIWLCGQFTGADVTTLNDPASGDASDEAATETTIDEKYLPQSCRADT